MMSWCRMGLLGLFMLLPVLAMAGDFVGDIIAVDGKVTLRDNKARKTLAQVGMQVETGQMVKTAKGNVTCEHVVLATGNYAREAGRMLGIDVPAIPVEHQYIVTDSHPALELGQLGGPLEAHSIHHLCQSLSCLTRKLLYNE